MIGSLHAINIRQNGSGRTGSNETALEERTDLLQVSADNFAYFSVVRCNLDRRVNKKASALLYIPRGIFNDLREKRAWARARGERSLQPNDTVTSEGLKIKLKHVCKQAAFVTKRGIETRPTNSHAIRQVSHGSRLISLLPETHDGGLQGLGCVEFSRPSHVCILPG